MPGLKLVQTVGFPGPWGQAVKKMFRLKNIPFISVAQYAAQENKALVEWLGIRNAPIIVPENGPPLSRWLDQMLFTENYAPTPALLPEDSAARATVFGLVNELAGEWGYGWCRRVMLFDDAFQANPGPQFRSHPTMQSMIAEYGISEKALAAAPKRCVDILNMLTARLKDQGARGSAFLVGSAVTFADIYWATFSTMLQPLDDEFCPMSPELRKSRTVRHPAILAAKDTILLEHRDMMYREYLGPLEF
jgi:glutathione S-transferase